MCKTVLAPRHREVPLTNTLTSGFIAVMQFLLIGVVVVSLSRFLMTMPRYLMRRVNAHILHSDCSINQLTRTCRINPRCVPASSRSGTIHATDPILMQPSLAPTGTPHHNVQPSGNHQQSLNRTYSYVKVYSIRIQRQSSWRSFHIGPSIGNTKRVMRDHRSTLSICPR